MAAIVSWLRFSQRRSELRLVNVARASMEELLLDYEDFLRHRRLTQWAPDSAEASTVRSVPRRFKQDRTDQSDQTNLTDLSDTQRWKLYSQWLDHAEPSVRANAIICLIHQCNYLYPTDLIPNCPKCGKPMALRTAKQGNNAGQQFWGCTGFPDCKSSIKI